MYVPKIAFPLSDTPNMTAEFWDSLVEKMSGGFEFEECDITAGQESLLIRLLALYRDLTRAGDLELYSEFIYNLREASHTVEVGQVDSELHALLADFERVLEEVRLERPVSIGQ